MALDRRFTTRRGKGHVPVRKDTSKRDDGTLVTRMENASATAADNIVALSKVIKQAFGDRPFGESKSDTAHELEVYSSIKDNPTFWGALIQEKGIGPVVKYSLRMESILARRHKSGTEADLLDAGL